MRPTRKKRLNDLMREILGELLLTKAGDARLAAVTITAVEISPELDVAKVFFSVLGDEDRRKSTFEALRKAAPFLRTELSREVRLRRTPELRFVFDEALERGLHMERVLREVAEERARREAAEAEAGPTETDDAS